jgi:UDPglucose--hexose-1-phosphate uridylyltransferase
VIHSPRHVRSIAELDEAAVELVAEAWRRRAHDEAGPYVQALVNEGAAAGASLPHSHSQLVWLPEAPPAVTAEQALPAGELVVERDGLRVVSPWAARLPYELQIAPAEPESGAFSSDLLPSALRLLAEMVRRLHAVEGPVPLNAWLHDGPHWHLELVPRLTVLAGLELGAGVYVNSLPSEEAAARLREARAV